MAADSKNLIKFAGREYEYRIWDPSEQPLRGDVFSIDTETHLIEESWKIPDMVIMTVCNGKMVDVVKYDLAGQYLNYLDQFNPSAKYVFFNVAFDYWVLKEHPALKKAANEDRVYDMMIRNLLRELATRGFWMESETGLAAVTRNILNETLAKDDAVRLTFRQNEIPTEEQLRYASLDAIATYLLYERMVPRATETLNTRAAIALEGMTNRGLLVDRDRFNELAGLFTKYMSQLEMNLAQFGYPVEDKPVSAKYYYARFCRQMGADPVDKYPRGPKLKAILGSAIAALGKPKADMMADVRTLMETVQGRDLNKKQKASANMHFELVCDTVGLGDIKGAAADRAFLELLSIIGDDIHSEDFNAGKTILRLGSEYDINGGWLTPAKKVGSTTFMQMYLADLEQKSRLVFPRTDPTKKNIHGNYSISKDNFYFFQENGFGEDPLIGNYMDYKHAEKMLTGFLNEKFIREDGRTHPRVHILKKTGRISMVKPNLQQIPRKHSIREMYVASPGHVLIDADYSQVELCALADTCFTRFGHSKMRDRINAGIDLHAHLAAMTDGTLTESNDWVPGDDESLKNLKDLLKAYKIDKTPQAAARQLAKAGNFGFPGGMSPARFLATQRKEGSAETKKTLTLEKSAYLRDMWFKAYPEMKEYFDIKECPSNTPGERFFTAETLAGHKRVNCTWCACLNLPFQGLASHGTKQAAWDLHMAGYKLINCVHDEFIVEVPEDSDLKHHYENIQNIMVSAMEKFIRNVKVRTEASITRRWCKDAKQVFSGEGYPLIWDDLPQNQQKETICDISKLLIREEED